MVTFDYKKTPITQIADYIIMYSAKSGASDIHFDPRDDGLMVRIRIDGELQNYTLIPKEYERNLTTRLKLLANMNITESRLPQDGAIKGTFGKLYLDMRVSSLPTNLGEKIVIRILDYSRSLEGLGSLGFSEKNFEKLKRMIAEPNGMILVTGATGSGKSTTTYSILQELNKSETNIITVEDPIEMNIEGLNQVQVNSEIGLSFSKVLRSILRQDPNIILIGEIRDSETAKIAVRASITGHLVLSTIHTNNSLSTIERLLDMDVERYLLSSALTGIISQRLAKRLCKKCREKSTPTPYEKKIFKSVLNKDVDTIYTAHQDGCDNCHKGYKGRIAIQEVLEIDDEIKDALNNEKLSKEERRELVYKSDVITMLQDGLTKVLEGYTSFDEIYRIIEIDSDSNETYLMNMEKTNSKNKSKKEKNNQNKTAANIQTTENITSNIEKENGSKETASEITKEAPKSIINEKKDKEKNKDIIIEIPHIPVNLEKNDYMEENNTINDDSPLDDFYSPIKTDNEKTELSNMNIENNIQIPQTTFTEDKEKEIINKDASNDTLENSNNTEININNSQETETPNINMENNIQIPTSNQENNQNEITYGELSNDTEQNIKNKESIESENNEISMPILEQENSNSDITYGELSNEVTEDKNLEATPQIIDSIHIEEQKSKVN